MRHFVNIYIGSKAVLHEVTPWFPPEVKPVYEGDYVVGSDLLHVMQTWDGKCWRRGNGSVAPEQDLCWRGWTGKLL